MLQITIPAREYFDDSKQEFIPCKAYTLSLEHSLISISKWEGKWKKPFLAQAERTFEESIDYIRCMTMTPGIPSEAYYGLTPDLIKQVTDYINDPMTATWFNEPKQQKKGRNQTVTSELIYYWMIAFNIPQEYQKWHLSRLLTLIRICEIKNQPEKKMSKKDIYARNRALNEARRKKYGTKG